MYIIIFLISIIFRLSNLYAFDISEVWNQQNRLQLEIRCDSTDRICNELCQHYDNCKIEEKICNNCVGTSMLMNSIFEQMGIKYRSTQEEVSSYELIDFLNKKNFVSFTSKSIFNQIDSYDSPSLKSRFQSLCSENVAYPLVIFELSPITFMPRSVKFVVCGGSIYRMSDLPEILTNSFILKTDLIPE